MLIAILGREFLLISECKTQPWGVRRARVVQSFPSRASLVRLVGAVLSEEEDAWAQRRVFSPESAGRAWSERRRPVPTELELKTAERRARDVVAQALDRAAARA